MAEFFANFLETQGDYLQYIFRILLAVGCGTLIGLERKNKLKDAGIRTHVIVALGAALIMVVSKYGFYDVIGVEGLRADTSRIAAQVVSGIGFLGAGMIFVKKQSISGLTTAAGVWATGGLGLAIGAGMYIVGIVATIIIVLTQTFLQAEKPAGQSLVIEIGNRERYLESLRETLEKSNVEILSMHIEKTYDDTLRIETTVRMPAQTGRVQLLAIMKDIRGLHSLDF